MKPHANCILIGLCLAALSAPLSGRAATIWTGPTTTFTDVDGSDPTQAVNQDRLTPNVWITRGSSQGIYNAKTETGFTHTFSPADTEWADGTTATYSSLSYMDWNTWAQGHPGGPVATVGVSAVVHLISDDIYLNVQFTSWGQRTGGFSWQRSTPAPANVPPTVAITSPTNGASFTAPAIVPITATATDSDGSVTNVAFFDGATFLGATNNTPYSVTNTFAAGSHALTAVATDNGGLSTTSTVVNVTVSTPNVPPSVTITNPADNSVFGNTDRVTIGASVTNGTGTVTNVQLFNGAVLLRSFATAPYTFTATGIAGN